MKAGALLVQGVPNGVQLPSKHKAFEVSPGQRHGVKELAQDPLGH